MKEIEWLKTRAQGRPLMLWGARQLGLSVFKSLARLGRPPEAFIDSSPDVQRGRVLGLEVLAPETALAREPRPFVIICSSVFEQEIAAACCRGGLSEGRDFLAATELQKCSWFVDVAGSCNLRCLSCPRGNWPRQPKPGFMSLELYELILDKIAAEDPFAGVVNLYSWGEPLLHPRLPAIIELTRRKGFEAALSSNLSFRLDFEAVIQARPAYFRVSASGWGPNYELTHAGGDWELFLANLERLRTWWPRHHPDMQVEMNFHIYKDRQEDYRRMKEYCDQAGFIFRAGHGMLSPLDQVDRLIDGLPLSPAAEKSKSLQALPVERGLELLATQKGSPCSFETVLDINFEGRARACQGWFEPSLPFLADDFLRSPLEEILERRRTSELCRRCRQKMIHRWCGVYADESLTGPRSGEGRS